MYAEQSLAWCPVLDPSHNSLMQFNACFDIYWLMLILPVIFQSGALICALGIRTGVARLE